MLRRTLGPRALAPLATAAMLLSALVPAPAGAVTGTRSADGAGLPALLGALLDLDGDRNRDQQAAPGARAADPATWGSTRAPDRRLRKGCRDYPYRYRIHPPTDEWQAELLLVDPRRERLAHQVFDSDSEAGRGRSHWRICRVTTRPGRFKIRMKVTWFDDGESESGWVDPSYFRLRRR